jgi:hypothetical protein
MPSVTVPKHSDRLFLARVLLRHLLRETRLVYFGTGAHLGRQTVVKRRGSSTDEKQWIGRGFQNSRVFAVLDIACSALLRFVYSFEICHSWEVFLLAGRSLKCGTVTGREIETHLEIYERLGIVKGTRNTLTF